MLSAPRQMPQEGYIVDKNHNVCKEINAGDKVYIKRAEQLEYYKKYVEVDKRITFTKLFCKASDILAKINFTPSEAKIIFAMLSHISFGELSGYLIKIRQNSFDGYLNESDLCKIVTMNKRTFDRAIKGLVEKEIIQLEKEGRNNFIIVNPFIFMKGDKITRTQYEKFKSSIFNVREK